MNETETRKPFFALRSHRFYNVAILVTSLLVLVFIPLFILTPEQIKQYVNNGRELQVVGDLLAAGVVISALLGIVYWVSAWLRFPGIGAVLVMLVFSWVALAGFLFPLTTASGLFDLRHEPTFTRNMIIVRILACVFAVLFVSRFSKTAQVFMAIFLTISIVPTLPGAFSKFEKWDDGPAVVSLSPEKNLLVIGMDGLPGRLVDQALQSSPEFSQTFKDFTFYKDVTSTSPATDGSLMGAVYGNHNFTEYDNPTWVNSDELYFNQSDKINFITSFKYNSYNKDGLRITAGQFGKAEQRNELYEVYHNVALRLGGNLGAQAFFWGDVWLFPGRKGKFFDTVDGYDRLINTMQVSSDRPSVFYTHFTFTHWPVVTDENCVNRYADTDWYYNNQNVAGINAGITCGFKKYTELIVKLKALGVYDQTTIVLLSDHGKPVVFYEDGKENLKINNGDTLGYDRYRPFLMIKPVNQTADKIAYSDRQLLIDDLAQTTCYLFENSEKCEQTPGVNILDESDIPPDDFYIHVVKDEKSGWAMTHHKAVKLPRNMPLLDAMQASDEIVLSEQE